MRVQLGTLKRPRRTSLRVQHEPLRSFARSFAHPCNSQRVAAFRVQALRKVSQFAVPCMDTDIHVCIHMYICIYIFSHTYVVYTNTHICLQLFVSSRLTGTPFLKNSGLSLGPRAMASFLRCAAAAARRLPRRGIEDGLG